MILNVSCKEKSFGEWLRTRRFERRLKSQEAAERAGMRLQSWSNYEHDWRRNKADRPTQPRLETLRSIAAGLDMSVEDVIAAARYYFASDLPPSSNHTSTNNHERSNPESIEYVVMAEAEYTDDLSEVIEYYTGLSSIMKPAAKELLRRLFEEDVRLQEIRKLASRSLQD